MRRQTGILGWSPEIPHLGRPNLRVRPKFLSFLLGLATRKCNATKSIRAFRPK